MVRSYFKGYPIVYKNNKWVYEGNEKQISSKDSPITCKKCGAVFDDFSTDEPDPCLGNLPGVINACCGHGVQNRSYIEFTNGLIIRGFTKIEYGGLKNE